jgi:oligoendopeptidase F
VVNNKKQINEYLKANSISEHQRRFNLIFQTEPHILPENEQKILSTIGIINSGFATIFSTLKDTEIKFKDAVTSKNKKIPLETITDIMKCLNHKDRSVRKST